MKGGSGKDGGEPLTVQRDVLKSTAHEPNRITASLDSRALDHPLARLNGHHLQATIDERSRQLVRKSWTPSLRDAVLGRCRSVA